MLAITFLLYLGIKESKRVNNIMVILKVLVVLLFIAVAAVYVKPHNWQPFIPMGFGGVFSAAALVFFSLSVLTPSLLPLKKRKIRRRICRKELSFH